MATSTKTMRDIVTRAMRRLGVIRVDQIPDASEAAEVLRGLNGMMLEWPAEGVDTSHVELALNDLFPLDTKYEDGVSTLLAVRIADEYGATLKPATVTAAGECWKNLLAAYLDIAEEAEFDPVLVHMPSQRHLLDSFG